MNLDVDFFGCPYLLSVYFLWWTICSHLFLIVVEFSYHWVLWVLHVFSGEGNGNPLQCSAWKIPGTREPGGLPSVLSHRVGHDWSDTAAAAACILNTSSLLDKKFKIFSLSLWHVFFFFIPFQRPNIFNFNDLINHIFLVCIVYLRSCLSTPGLTWDVEDFLLHFYILHLRLWSILNQCLHKMYNMY